MFRLITSYLIAIIFILGIANNAIAVQLNLIPKYGKVKKNEKTLKIDVNFLKDMDKLFEGDRVKASKHTESRGWNYLYKNQPEDSMRRFNQAWLLNNENWGAIWGMAILESERGNDLESLKLFQEAGQHINSVEFQSDFARILGFVGKDTDDKKMIEKSMKKFGEVYKKAPDFELNIKNWAIAYHYFENYKKAWEKILILEKLKGSQVSDEFVLDLTKRMPRP